MAAMREAWTDERLDDLNAKVDRGFDRLDGDVGDLRREMNSRFDSVEGRIGQAIVALATGMLVGFGGLAGLIATQL